MPLIKFEHNFKIVVDCSNGFIYTILHDVDRVNNYL